ncbi:cytochrome P450 [Streptomyces sp. NPDC054796]
MTNWPKSCTAGPPGSRTCPRSASPTTSSWSLFSPYQLHHDPAYFPFGAGRRRCLGDTYALAETVITLSSPLPRWRLRTVDGSRTRPRFRSSLDAAGMRMVPTARTAPARRGPTQHGPTRHG